MNTSWSIRSYKDGDRDELFDLTREVWGSNVPEKAKWINGWKWLHLDNPAGPSEIWLAKDKDKIVSQYPVILEDFKINDKIVKASQLVDTMTHPRYRRRGLAIALGDTVLNKLRNEGIHFAYCFPTEQAYALHLRSNWNTICNLQVLVKPLNINNIVFKRFIKNQIFMNLNEIIKNKRKKYNELNLETGPTNVKRISNFDRRINAFWEIVSDSRQIIRIRNQDYLNWRYFGSPNTSYTVFIAEENKNILGYIVGGCVKDRNGLLFGYIHEILAIPDRSDIIKILLKGITNYFVSQGVDLIYSKMATTNVYRNVFLLNGFIPYLNSTERLMVFNMSKDLSSNFLDNKSNWFIQLGDLPSVY